MKLRARFLPRNATDFLLASLVICLQCAALFLMPSLIILALTHSAFGAFAEVVFVAIFVNLYSVASIAVNEQGIEFSRICGTPKFLAWQDIKEIAPASRRELILHGWLWPLLPAREMTPSLTSIGHYRIAWTKGWCYFPPQDAELFLRLVAGNLQSS